MYQLRQPIAPWGRKCMRVLFLSAMFCWGRIEMAIVGQSSAYGAGGGRFGEVVQATRAGEHGARPPIPIDSAMPRRGVSPRIDGNVHAGFGRKRWRPLGCLANVEVEKKPTRGASVDVIRGRWSRVITLGVLLGTAMSWGAAQQSESVRRSGSAAIDAALKDSSEVTVRRLREGTVLSQQLGEFNEQAGRIAFQLKDQETELVVLENLALERVWKMLRRARGRSWVVSGTVTEYRGENYLLLERAVLRARGVEAPPESTP